MTRAFYDGLYTRCVVYVDDIMVFGRTREEHDNNLEWVLQRCRDHHVKINREKCCFAKTEAPYLGFMESGTQIKPLPEKTDALAKIEPTKSKRELRAVIGKLNFYSRFIPEYSRKLEPLRSLLVKNTEFKWSDYQQRAYQELTKRLNSVDGLFLEPPDSHKVVTLKILADSMEVGLTGRESRLLMRASRLLTPQRPHIVGWRILDRESRRVLLG